MARCSDIFTSIFAEDIIQSVQDLTTSCPPTNFVLQDLTHEYADSSLYRDNPPFYIDDTITIQASGFSNSPARGLDFSSSDYINGLFYRDDTAIIQASVFSNSPARGLDLTSSDHIHSSSYNITSTVHINSSQSFGHEVSSGGCDSTNTNSRSEMTMNGTIHLRYRSTENENSLTANISSGECLRTIYDVAPQTFGHIDPLSFPLSDLRRETSISFGFQDEEEPSITDEQKGWRMNNAIAVRQQFLGITDEGNRYQASWERDCGFENAVIVPQQPQRISVGEDRHQGSEEQN